MEYIYDIILNFQNNYYEFYEWQKKDKIINIKKIPIYKINNQDYLNIKNNKVIIDKSSLPKTNKMFLLTNNIEIIGIIINNKGYVIKKSSMLPSEIDDILLDKDHFKKINIKYQIIKNNLNILKGRLTLEKEKYLNNYLKRIKDNEYLLKYIYYDIYHQEENNINKIYDIFINLSKNNPNEIYQEIKKINLELNK